MTEKMQQYSRDKLYLPTANSANATQPPQPGDYQGYKKESAFRRLVSGALRGPGERQRRRPSEREEQEEEGRRRELKSKRQTIAGPPEPTPRPRAPPPPSDDFERDRDRDRDRDRRRRSHRKSTFSEAPRQPPRDDYDYHKAPDDHRYSKQSVRRPELKPLSSNPVVTPVDPNSWRPMNPKAENRATVDARRPYTTERLSRGSGYGRRREY